MQNLPIRELLPAVVDALSRQRRLVLQAPPGAGKSTAVPPALLGLLDPKAHILVAEPRRIAARLLANRVSSELRQQVGELVGYRVRFEDVSSKATRLYYVTSGVLLRRLTMDPDLRGVGCVIIDEFHERHLDTDLALALALRAQRTTRPDLMIVVMSATLQGERLQQIMGGCPFLRSEEGLHRITIEHAAQPDERPLAKQVVSAVKTLLRQNPQGNVLVFLPGAAEIRRAQDALSTHISQSGLEVLALHGDMALRDQATVLQPSLRPKVVLSTNVAESSITVPGIVGVVDSGLCHTAVCSPWSGLVSIEMQKISRASAVQRAGRAGRTTDGKVIRLFTKGDFLSRSEFETPEILRTDLCEAVLLCHGLAISDLGSLDLVDPPPAAQLRAAEELLTRLKAISHDRSLTDAGRQILQFPLHPRLARLVLEADHRGAGVEGCLAAALLSERDLRLDTRAHFVGQTRNLDRHKGDSDLTELIDSFEVAKALGFRADRCRNEGIDPSAARSVADASRQLWNCLGQLKRRAGPPAVRERVEEILSLAVLSAYPDRVARRRELGRRDVIMTNGSVAELSDQSVVHDAQYLVAIQADERAVGGRKAVPKIRLACRIDPNWLLELHADQVTMADEDNWVQPPGRVETVSTIRYGAVVVDESRSVARPGPNTARLLASIARERGVFRDSRVSSLGERIGILIESGLLSENDRLSDAALTRALEQLCADRVDLDGVDAAALAYQLLAGLAPAASAKMRGCAPEHYALPGGRSVVVHYESGRDPWIESRLQDFFGMTDTPRICDGRRLLTVHLLAPNQRAVQVTQDLNGFWDRHYPAIRRELMRRYPKHFWPEDGRAAAPVRMNRR